MIKDDVLHGLRQLGFRPEEVDDFGYEIEYEGVTILFATDDEDKSRCLSFYAPNVGTITDDNRLEALQAMIRLSDDVRYVKPQIGFEGRIWICYQHFLGETEVSEELLEHIIRVLAYATFSFNKIFNEPTAHNTEEDDDDE